LPLDAQDRKTRVTPDVFFGPGAHFSGARGGGPGGPVRATFKPKLPRAGRYEICVASRPSAKMATNVPVLVRHAGGDTRVALDQRNTSTPFPFTSIGEFRFDAGEGAALVEMTNAGADGRVTADAVRWVWVGE
jgi:hypothetical protein